MQCDRCHERRNLETDMCTESMSHGDEGRDLDDANEGQKAT
jgi:hypothetical protein